MARTRKEIRFWDMGYFCDFAMAIFEVDFQGEATKIAKLVFEDYDAPFSDVEPTARLKKEEIQGLMDNLWAIGIRPSNGEGNAGQLGATEKHLEDMRKIAFKGLGMDK
jgi:hypothetical protein